MAKPQKQILARSFEPNTTFSVNKTSPHDNRSRNKRLLILKVRFKQVFLFKSVYIEGKSERGVNPCSKFQKVKHPVVVGLRMRGRERSRGRFGGKIRARHDSVFRLYLVY